MARFGLVLVLAVTLLHPGQAPASMGASPSLDHARSGIAVCSIDPTWGIGPQDRTDDTNGNVRVPAQLDPSFEVRAPCLRGEEAEGGLSPGSAA